MTKINPYAITISRQLGSGGSYLGQRIASRLNILYLDREIVNRVAKKLRIPEDTVALSDEKLTPFRQTLSRSYFTYSSAYSYASYVPPSLDMVTDETIYSAESDVILKAAQEQSVVIIGRGGFHVLQQHPRHLSIFLHADVAFRQQRIQKLYCVSARQAGKLIESVDKERARYLHIFTGLDWADSRQYHLCLDTGILGLDKAEEIIIEAVKAMFGDVLTAG